MKKLVFASMTAAAFGITSCCFCEGHDEVATDEHHHADSTEHAEAEEGHHEHPPVAFDGVDRGGYTLYGHTDITPDGAMTSAQMFAHMDSHGAFNDKVQVSIAQVCQKAGCWITFNKENGEEVRVFFRDHFTIPIETPEATEAILYGQLVIDTLSVEFQKHLLDDARDAGEEIPQSEYDAITEDKIETTFDCESILVKKAAAAH